MTLGKFIDTQKRLVANVEAVERLKAQLKQLTAVEALIFCEMRGGNSYRLDEAINAMQDPLEELIARVETEISDRKKNADYFYRELQTELFDKDEVFLAAITGLSKRSVDNA